MKKALVLGISGAFGGSVARALVENGWSVCALVRRPQKMSDSLSNVELITGDAGDYATLKAASQTVDAIVYAVNTPYNTWADLAEKLLSPTLRVAHENQIAVLFPENVYLFNPYKQSHFQPDSVPDPVTELGAIRLSLLTKMQEASRQGAQIIVLRCGDFMGVGLSTSWFNRLVTVSGNSIKLMSPASNRDVPHTWAYLPDVAKYAVCLLNKRQQLAPYNCFHFTGYSVSFNELGKSLEKATSKKVKITAFPWWQVHIGALFVPLFQGVKSMRYLWEKPLLLDGGSLWEECGKDVRDTPIEQAMVEMFCDS